MKTVFGVFVSEMLMPYCVESLLFLYADKSHADAKAAELTAVNTHPMEEDDYGPVSGQEFYVKELQIL